MPRPLADYGRGDWLHLRPLTQALKTWRYRLTTALFVRRPPRGGDLAGVRRTAAGRRLLVTVAFEDAAILDRQLAGLLRHLDDVVLLVADNSRRADGARAVASVCSARGVPCLRLPDNPWSRRAPSRSHGLALDWVWRQVVVPAAPAAVGFLDQDLIPFERCDPFEPLARQIVHGDKRWAGARWFLWAGYCFFRPAALRGRRIDFGQDWFVGLDTGGGNWEPIYRHLDPRSLQERPITQVAVLPDGPAAACYVERRGSWLHEAGLDTRPELKPVRRAFFLNLLDRLEAAPTAAP